MLGYLGPKKDTWSATLAKKRELYKQFIGWFEIKPIFVWNNMILFLEEMVIPPGDGEQDRSGCVDHPLSDGPESNWNTFFKDNEVLLQIDKDVRRLCPDISFFQQVSFFFFFKSS